MEKEVRQMSIKEMWNYLIFQTKGYRQLGAAIVAGAVCGAGISYINSILYARIIDTLLLEQYTTAVHYVWIMILAVLVVRMVYIMCNLIFLFFNLLKLHGKCLLCCPSFGLIAAWACVLFKYLIAHYVNHPYDKNC